MTSIPINLRLKQRREALGLTENDIAIQAGITVHEYGDIEQHRDEFLTATPLRTVRKICVALGVPLSDLLPPYASVHNQTPVSRELLVARRMQELRISARELGDRMGFETEAMERVASESDYLEGWPITLIERLAAEIGIPVEDLLAF